MKNEPHQSNNVSAEEIKQFTAMANDWWDKQGRMKPLHDINPLRLEYITDHTELANKQVLDIGCGGGILSESLAKAQANVTAIDRCEALIEAGKAHAGENNLDIDYQIKSAEDLVASHRHHFDIITCMELLEHVPDPQQLVKVCSELIKPNGYIFFSTINRTVKSFLFAIVGAEYVLGLLPRGTHHYAKLIRPSELHHWAQLAKLHLEDMKGMSYQPFSGECKLISQLDINYLACFKAPN